MSDRSGLKACIIYDYKFATYFLNAKLLLRFEYKVTMSFTWLVTKLTNSIIQVNTKTWHATLKKVGITEFRWHDLRHTWASWHVQAGTPLHVLQELGGWESVEMVRKYAHLSSDHLTQYVDRFSTIQAGEGSGATFGLRAIK